MPTLSPFLERLRRGPILCDGAMGTELYARGVSYERCFEQLNLTDPELVKTIHLEYAAAGAEIIETNTFGANRYRLAEHGLEHNVRTRLHRAGEAATRVGLEIIKEVFDRLCSSVQGTYIITLGRYDLVGELLPYIRVLAQSKKH